LDAETMQVPRARFSIRRIVIAIAIVAVAIAGAQTYRRWLDYKKRFRAYAAYESFLREEYLWQQSLDDPQLELCGMVKWDKEDIRRFKAESARFDRENLDYFHRMSEKYALAMTHPWLPVEPDPDELDSD
jgi:hypothetical protein